MSAPIGGHAPEIYLACYPRVGSEYLKKSLLGEAVMAAKGAYVDYPSVVQKTHSVNIDWLEKQQILSKDTKIIYLCDDPVVAVSSMINQWYGYRLSEYKHSLRHEKVSTNILKSYDNIYAAGPGGWEGNTTLQGSNYVFEALTPTAVADISANFVSYIINDDFLGYKEHFDTWTKTPLPYKMCIVRYEYLQNSETLRSLEEFLEKEPFYLQPVAEKFNSRKTSRRTLDNLIGSRSKASLKPGSLPPYTISHGANAPTIEDALIRAYGELAAEINELDGFSEI
tara:strand:- start:3290 stop:4135 length:846 start_codon:yes stop_codon:yes gene_type:complete